MSYKCFKLEIADGIACGGMARTRSLVAAE